MAETFIFRKEWLNNLAHLSVEEQDKVIADMVRYCAEEELQHPEDSTVKTILNFVKNNINYSRDKYQQKLEAGLVSGRKKKVDDEKILRLALEGKSAVEIAEILGYSKSAVDHSDGWKWRKEKNTFNIEDF